MKNDKIKKILGTAFFLLVNAGVVLLMLFLENRTGEKPEAGEGKTFFMQILTNPFSYVALLAFWIVAAVDIFVLYALMRKQCGIKNLRIAAKSTVLGRYYEKITPWAVGGAPAQIAVMAGDGLDAGDASAVILSRHTVRLFTIVPVVIIILVASMVSTDVWVMVFAALSVLISLILPVFLLICCLKPAFGQKIGRGIIKFLHKIKIIKNVDKALESMQKKIDTFLTGMRVLGANKTLLPLMIISAVFETFILNSVPFFVMRASGAAVPYWHTFVLCIFVNYAAGFAPTPGGAGLAELSFYAIFSGVFAGGYLFWAVLFWRICIFYAPVAVGLIVQIFTSVKKLLAKKTAQQFDEDLQNET